MCEKSSMEYDTDNINNNTAITNNQVSAENQAINLIVKLNLIPCRDGDQWCFLLGVNLQEGVAGFGNSVNDAAIDFSKSFYRDESGAASDNLKHKKAPLDTFDKVEDEKKVIATAIEVYCKKEGDPNSYASLVVNAKDMMAWLLSYDSSMDY